MIKCFSEIDLDDINTVGGKAAMLGELTQSTDIGGFVVPDGVVFTTDFYFKMINEWGIAKDIEGLLKSTENTYKSIKQNSKKIRDLFEDKILPFSLLAEVVVGTDVAVRSSSPLEDTIKYSFAGQHDSFLNSKDILGDIVKCYTSLFSERSFHYRIRRKIPLEALSMAVIVQKMALKSVQAISGVIFTLNDGEGGYSLSATEGHADRLVRGEELSNDSLLTSGNLINLKHAAFSLQDYLNEPMDVEWVIDKASGDIYIVQARPLCGSPEEGITDEGRVPYLRGQAVGSGQIKGVTKLINSPDEYDDFPEGGILVTKNTSPEWTPILNKASGIITDVGCSTCHAAIAARELKIPAIVGTIHGTNLLKNKMSITMHCSPEGGNIHLEGQSG